MKKAHIRPLAICVFRHQDHILVAEGYDEVNGQSFYRPLGGGIEFGEHSCDTVTRELHEELGAEVADLRYLGALENIFTFNGQPRHEIVFVFDGAFVDHSLYQKSVLQGNEDDVTAIWMPLAAFSKDRPPLYPDGLLELLQTNPADSPN